MAQNDSFAKKVKIVIGGANASKGYTSLYQVKDYVNKNSKKQA